jgi:hypothetical protein
VVVTITLRSGDRSVTMTVEALDRLVKRVQKITDEELTRLLLLELELGEVGAKAEGAE